MTTPIFTIDGTDVATFGAIVERWEGDLSPAFDRPPSVPSGHGYGERPSGAPAIVAPRVLTAYLTLLADTVGELRTARDGLMALASGVTSGTARGATAGAVTVVFGTDTALQITAYLSAPTKVDREAGAMLDGDVTAAVALVFTALDPLAYDATATTHALSSTTARCAVGNAPSRPVLTLAGPFTSRVVTLVDGADVTQGTLTITGAVLSGESVVVDCDEESVQHVVGGVATPVSTWMTAGDCFALAPADVVGGIAPGVKLNAGTGSITYRRAWP